MPTYPRFNLSGTLSNVGPSSTQSSPHGKNKTQTFSPAISSTSPATCLPATSTCPKTSSLGAATHRLPEKVRANAPKAKAVEGDAEKAEAKAKIKAMAAHSLTTNTLSNHLSAHASTSAKRKPSKSLKHQMTTRIPWIPTLALKLPTDLDNRHSITRFCVCTAQINTSDVPETSDTNPNPAIYYYCAYHAFNLSHHGHQCRVMSKDDSYTQQQKQATLPSDCTPRGNDAVEPQRHFTFLKSWGRYSK